MDKGVSCAITAEVTACFAKEYLDKANNKRIIYQLEIRNPSAIYNSERYLYLSCSESLAKKLLTDPKLYLNKHSNINGVLSFAFNKLQFTAFDLK